MCIRDRISTPIIYRDLKPEHIIVCHNKLKLIDFGVSAYVIQDGNNFNHYGNIAVSYTHLDVYKRQSYFKCHITAYTLSPAAISLSV